MARPQLSDEITQVVKELHREQTGAQARSVEEALETVVQLAQEGLDHKGWYPGKYAEKAFDRVLGNETSRSMVQEHRTGPVQEPAIDPDRQAVFKEHLSEDGTVSIPDPERQALGLAAGELLQVIAYPAGGVQRQKPTASEMSDGETE